MNCRNPACQCELHEIEQRYEWMGRDGQRHTRPSLTFVECHNPACVLWMFTLSKATYETRDLSAYLKGEVVK